MKTSPAVSFMLVAFLTVSGCAAQAEPQIPPTSTQIPPSATFTALPTSTPTSTATPEPTETNLPTAKLRICIIFDGERVNGHVWLRTLDTREQVTGDLKTKAGCRWIVGIKPGAYRATAIVTTIEECYAPHPCRRGVEYHAEPGSETEIEIEVFEVN